MCKWAVALVFYPQSEWEVHLFAAWEVSEPSTVGSRNWYKESRASNVKIPSSLSSLSNIHLQLQTHCHFPSAQHFKRTTSAAFRNAPSSKMCQVMPSQDRWWYFVQFFVPLIHPEIPWARCPQQDQYLPSLCSPSRRVCTSRIQAWDQQKGKKSTFLKTFCTHVIFEGRHHWNH